MKRKNSTPLTLYILFMILLDLNAQIGPGAYVIVPMEAKVCDDGKPTPHSSFTIIHNNLTMSTRLEFFNKVGPVQGRIKVFKWTDGRFVLSFTNNQKNVCTYFTAMKMLSPEFKADKNCVVQKCIVEQNDLNLNDMTHQIMGNSFFYGKFKFIIEWFTKKARIFCMNSTIVIRPA